MGVKHISSADHHQIQIHHQPNQNDIGTAPNLLQRTIPRTLNQVDHVEQEILRNARRTAAMETMPRGLLKRSERRNGKLVNQPKQNRLRIRMLQSLTHCRVPLRPSHLPVVVPAPRLKVDQVENESPAVSVTIGCDGQRIQLSPIADPSSTDSDEISNKAQQRKKAEKRANETSEEKARRISKKQESESALQKNADRLEAEENATTVSRPWSTARGTHQPWRKGQPIPRHKSILKKRGFKRDRAKTTHGKSVQWKRNLFEQFDKSLADPPNKAEMCLAGTDEGEEHKKYEWWV